MHQMWLRLRRHWIRYVLTIVQVALGIAAVTAVVADVMPALQPNTTDQPEVFSVEYGTADGGMRSGIFQTSDVGFLLEHSETVEAAAVHDERHDTLIQVGGERYLLRGAASVTPGFFRVADLELVEGGFFGPADAKKAQPEVAVISRELAEYLFGKESAIGKTVNLRPEEEAARLRGFSMGREVDLSSPGTNLTIIGVYTGGDSLPGMWSPWFRNDLLIPLTSGPPAPAGNVKGTGMTVSRSRNYLRLYVRARPGLAGEAAAEVKALLEERITSRASSRSQLPGGGEFEVLVKSADSMSDAVRQGRITGALILGVMGLIALVVSGIAILTTQLASISERMRYIGLQRALGATRGRILREIMVEAALLAGFGGILGSAAAYPVGRYILRPLLQSFSAGGKGIALSSLIYAAAVGITLSLAIGAAAGLYPGWVAARVEPARAFKGDEA